MSLHWLPFGLVGNLSKLQGTQSKPAVQGTYVLTLCLVQRVAADFTSSRRNLVGHSGPWRLNEGFRLASCNDLGGDRDLVGISVGIVIWNMGTASA